MKKKLKHLQTFEQSTDKNLNISDVSDSNSKKSKFKINDIIIVTDGDLKNKLFKVVDIDYSHKTLELIKCKSVEFDSNKIHNFDNLCTDVVLRENEFDLDFLVKNFYLIKK
jgi:hypothetical protein